MTISRCEAPVIWIAAAIIMDDAGRTLLVRKRGTAAFMQPGGKLGAGETAGEALSRELKEELGCVLSKAPRSLGRFRAAAANEAGSIVEAELFAVELPGEAIPAAEIEETRWHDPNSDDSVTLAPLTRNHVLPMIRSWSRG